MTFNLKAIAGRGYQPRPVSFSGARQGVKRGTRIRREWGWSESGLEDLLGDALYAHAQLRGRFESQRWIKLPRGAGPVWARPDFAFEEKRLVVEADGPLHFHPDALDYDAERSRRLAIIGWRVERFTYRQIEQHADQCAERVARVLRGENLLPILTAPRPPAGSEYRLTLPPGRMIGLGPVIAWRGNGRLAHKKAQARAASKPPAVARIARWLRGLFRRTSG